MKLARSWGGEWERGGGVDFGVGNEGLGPGARDIGFWLAGMLDRGRRGEEEARGSKKKFKCALKCGDAWPERRTVGNLLTGGGGSIVKLIVAPCAYAEYRRPPAMRSTEPPLGAVFGL